MSDLTRHQQKLLIAAADILGENPTSEDFAFLARQLVQATLPHNDPKKEDVWIRQEGATRLIVRQGIDATGQPLGLPYGSLPRLLLYWLTTEAVRTKSRTIRLGRSMNEFLRALDLNPATGGGKRGDAARLRNQMMRLFAASITFSEVAQDDQGGRGFTRLDMPVTSAQDLWWNLHQPDQGGLWESRIELGEKFFAAITAAPVPLDVRALKALKRSPLALDLYAWCAYNAHRARQTGAPRWITWERLAKALGADYGRTDNFQQKARKELAKVRASFPGLRVGKRRGGLEILPESLPPISPRTLDKPVI